MKLRRGGSGSTGRSTIGTFWALVAAVMVLSTLIRIHEWATGMHQELIAIRRELVALRTERWWPRHRCVRLLGVGPAGVLEVEIAERVAGRAAPSAGEMRR